MSQELTEKTDTDRYYNQKLATSATRNDNTFTNAYNAYNKEWVHDSEILANGWTNPFLADHRRWMATLQELAVPIVKKVADAICKNELIIYNKKASLEGRKEKRQINKPAMFFWRKHQGQDMLRKAIMLMREQGIVIYSRNPRPKQNAWDTETDWRLLSLQHVTVINSLQGRLVNIQGNEAVLRDIVPFILTPKECIYYDPSNSDDKLGVSSLLCVWNKLLSLECIGSSLEIFLERLGNGFLHVDLPAGSPPEVVTAVKNSIKHLRSELGILTYSTPTTKSTAEFKTPSTSVAFDNFITSIKQDIAIGCGFPRSFLLNEEQTDEEKAVTQNQLLAIAKTYENFVKLVLIFNGLISSLDEVEVDFQIGKPVLDIEVAQSEIAHNSVIAGKLWMTIDEKRDLDNLPPLPNGDGATINPMGKTDKVNTSNNSGFADSNSNGDQEKTKPDQFERKQASAETKMEQGKSAGKVDSGLPDLSALEAESNRSLAEKLGISASTASKILSYVKTKEHACDVKMDSYQIVGDKLHFSATMLAPNDNLPYPDHTEEQSKEEVEKWYHDPNVSKELNLGIEVFAPHNGSAEVKRTESVGTIRAVDMDVNGFVKAEGVADLKKIDSLLGDNNYLRKILQSNNPIPLSAGLFSRDVKLGDNKIARTNLDVRSIMIVSEARNKHTSITPSDP